MIWRNRSSSSQEKSEEGLRTLRKSRESLPPSRFKGVEETGMGCASRNRLGGAIKPVFFHNRLNITWRLMESSFFFRTLRDSFVDCAASD